MANIREAGLRFDGTVRYVKTDRDDKGNEYATVQLENADGISDVSFSAQATRDLHAAGCTSGEVVSWIVRPYIVYGVSKRTGGPYGFLKLNYVRTADPGSR